MSESSSVTNSKWIREDIEKLSNMSIHGYTIGEMSRKLKRPRWSVIQALKRVQAQQALFYSIEEVAAAHHIDIDKFSKRLKDPLFYVPLQQNQIPFILVATTVVFGLVSLYGKLCCADL